MKSRHLSFRPLALVLTLLTKPAAPGTITATAPATNPGRPNVLLILADDLGFSDLSCYGGEIPTPHLSRLAEAGTRFSAFFNSARCCPSRASLMTGLHPHQAGIGSFTTERPQAGWGPAYTGHLLSSCVTLAEVLGSAGYSTWMVGKWHLGDPGPLQRGFQNYYGYRNFQAYAENQWDPGKYVRLPEGVPAEVSRPAGAFYVTDVFTDYALAFIRQARTRKDQPWLLYLAHSSPHFPVQAPRESIDRHVPVYRRGWDLLRAERFERMKRLGLVPAEATLPPRSRVPVDGDDIANGYSGQPNPAWDTLPADRREDLAYRMATYAAMVEHIDAGVGRILADLEAHGELDHTLILFLSDNGACYEWGPFGFDGPSRRGITTLHTGDELLTIGQSDSHQSYGSAWANLCNTPLNLYKHFCHEGGIASPLILHWPAGVQRPPSWVHDPSHLMDIVPTLCAAAGVSYPEVFNGQAITPVEGISLLPALRGQSLPERALAFEHQAARGLRRGDWKVVWGKRLPTDPAWELYNLRQDRSEQHNLAPRHPALTRELAGEWEHWARRVGAEPFQRDTNLAGDRPAHPTPDVRQRELAIACAYTPRTARAQGVLVAQGGREQGYAVHLLDGRPAFDVRINEVVTRIIAEHPVDGRVMVEAGLTRDHMILTVNGDRVAQSVSPGLLPVQPQDGLSVGEDTLSAAGEYSAPNLFDGDIHDLSVTPRTPGTRWSAEKAKAWYAAQPWPVGANFVPSSAINPLEMWQAETFDPDTIDRELGWAASIGMNTMRVFLHDIPWRQDAEGFCRRIDQYLAIADAHGMRTLFVLFDGVWNPEPAAGRQPEPRPRVHNSGWVQSPGRAILGDPSRHDELKPYVTGILRRFRADSRVLGWDLFNEPDNSNAGHFGGGSETPDLPPDQKLARAADLLEKSFAWARDVDPSQPLTAGVWGQASWLDHPDRIERISLDQSDVISFHTYDGPGSSRRMVEGLLKYERPILCTEYMSRGNNSTFEGILPLFHQHRIGAYNWGLVDGKTQTIYPWSSWSTPFTAEPDPWFHDVFRRDGTPYLAEEAALIRRLTRAPSGP